MCHKFVEKKNLLQSLYNTQTHIHTYIHTFIRIHIYTRHSFRATDGMNMHFLSSPMVIIYTYIK